ncbi:hypothetical protein PHYPSEUDO_013029 [Phytophthora pseudosyringae]|uniref:Uncharacterized protein n=1 Tax=Phytophthora pseudosyringae TaxID=221518 RepID=A0A8T1V6N7_9STRA|nr:hypothetical protein PHYPSEUDO_013029 [Phytophthora pseudosyringae]
MKTFVLFLSRDPKFAVGSCCRVHGGGPRLDLRRLQPGHDRRNCFVSRFDGGFGRRRLVQLCRLSAVHGQHARRSPGLHQCRWQHQGGAASCHRHLRGSDVLMDTSSSSAFATDSSSSSAFTTDLSSSSALESDASSSSGVPTDSASSSSSSLLRTASPPDSPTSDKITAVLRQEALRRRLQRFAWPPRVLPLR